MGGFERGATAPLRGALGAEPQAKTRFRVSKTQISLQKKAREGPRTKLQKLLVFALVGVWRDRRPGSTQGAVKAITWRMLAREQYRTASSPDCSQTLALAHILLPFQQIDRLLINPKFDSTFLSFTTFLSLNSLSLFLAQLRLQLALLLVLVGLLHPLADLLVGLVPLLLLIRLLFLCLL